jgi:DNA polymerase-1
MKKLIIIDISNFIFRAFFAVRPLHAPDGTPVNAVYGVLSMIYNLIVKYKPTHILIARDTKEGSFRKEIYQDYKAHRTDPPDDLLPQFLIIDELIKVLELPEVKLSKYEADDIIGSAATQWKKYFDEILIASGDKDLMQFVNGTVKMLDTMKDKIYSREDVKDKMGVYPEQVMDYLSLIGDSSDNIPGVQGIGPKGAQNLIQAFGNLENILNNINTIKNKRIQSALTDQKDLALISKKLVEIVCNLDLQLSCENTSYTLKISPKVDQFLEKVGFRSWQTKLESFKVQSNVNFVQNQKSESIETEIDVWTVDDMIKRIEHEKVIGLAHKSDNELNQHTSWRSLFITTSKSAGYIVLNLDETINFFNFLNNSKVLVVCYQSKPILQLAMISGMEPKFEYFDIAQAHFILNPEYRHDFDTITEEFLGRKLKSTIKAQIDLFGNNDKEELSYLGQKARAVLELYPILRNKMMEMNVEHPYSKLDIPLIKVLASMELEGISLDLAFYKELEKEFSSQIQEIEEKVFKLAGEKVNLRSPKQVGELLFEKLQLPIIRKTKTGYSTDAEVLSELSALNINPIPDLLLKYREVEKLLSTYVRALPTMVDPKTKKIHTHFQPSNAATGRLSSDNPNLQNIPVRTENGRKLRKGFIPSPGRVLLSADYSQVELRLLAHFSQDPGMLDAFENDKDIHQQTASEIFDVPLDQVTKDMRNSAKAINFGLMYGQTSFGLSGALHISQTEARKYITSYFQKFQSVKGFLDELKEKAEKTGYAETLFGRKRLLPDIKSTNRQIKSMAERVAINSPIQGTAADIIKLAMINIQNVIQERNFKSRMILQVHDELIFDVLPEELEEMKSLVRREMEGAVSLSVKLKVQIGVGKNWYDLK